MKGSSKILTYTCLPAFLLIILLNIFPSGGRSEGILGVLPLLFLITRSNRSVGRTIVKFAIPTLVIYIVYVTRASDTDIWLRTGMAYRLLGLAAGRFSMIGVGIKMATTYGYALGSTFLEGLANTINAPFVLFENFFVGTATIWYY